MNNRKMVRSDSNLWRPLFKCHSNDTVARKSLNLLEFSWFRWWNSQVYHIYNHVNYWKSLITENGSSNTFKFLFCYLKWCVGFFFILNETLFWFCLLFNSSVDISLHYYRYSGSSKAELCAEDLQWTTRILTAWTCTLTLKQEGVFIIFRLFSGWLGFIFLIHLTVFIFIWYKYKKIQCPCLIHFFPNGNKNLLFSKIITRLLFPLL